MANKIKLRRGNKSSMPTLDEGELAYVKDEQSVYVGTSSGNKELVGNGGGGGLTPEQEAKLNLIKDNGVGDKYLADDGNYKVVSGGGGEIDLDTLGYMNYAADVFYRGGHQSLFSNAWQDMKDSESVLFDIPLALAAPNQEMAGETIDLYVGTNGQLQALYDACVNETIPPPIDIDTRDVYYVNNVATFYMGDVSGDVGFPIPLYNFGSFNANDNTSFLIGDLTPLQMGLGLVLAKIAGVPIPNNNIVIQQGFEFENENGIIIPNSVTSIGDGAFYSWTSNNQPLVIPDSVTTIGNDAFYNWTSNNQPLTIPNSVTSIGSYAFQNWSSNDQPLVIPNSVTSIGEYAFSYWESNNQQLIIPNSVTSIGYQAFYNWGINNQPLVIPDSVTSIDNFAFYNWESNNQQLIIPNSVTGIGSSAFRNWTSNNQQLIIPNSVTSIGDLAFAYWESNNQQLIIPNSVTSIGYQAFYNWGINNQPLVIPDSVTSIDNFAFAGWTSVPYIEIQATTPPTLAGSFAFNGQNNAPIYVPDESVDDYKTATNWVNLSSRIFPISDKDNTYTKEEIDTMIGDIESALDAILGV